MNSKNIRIEALYMLLESSLKSVPFNIILAVVLSINLYFNDVPLKLIITWFITIFCISVVRLIYSKLSLKNNQYKIGVDRKKLQFSLLTFLTGCSWGAAYFVFLPQISISQEYMIILVLGGMAAGGIASLSVYMPAYYCFLLPMFLPLLIYNFYIFKLDEIIVAIMSSLFTLMLIIAARINSELMKKNFNLGEEKDKLIKKLQETNEKLNNSIEEIRQMSITDFLTGLYNRRHFNSMIKNEFNRAKRNKYDLTLVLIDVDNFKTINDSYGHPYGDNFLIEVAQSIKSALKRSNDTVFRLGGDEFAILMANVSLDDSLKLCSHIQNTFKQNINNDNVGLSMGVISISSNNSSNVEHLISVADTNLYEAKKQGKNQVISKCISFE